MKRLFPIWALLALLLAGGCSKSTDYLEEPEPEPKPDDEPTEQFEQLCKQANMNIASLQALVAAMQEGDYVKAVIPIMQEVKEKSKEIGHTITFESRDSITIYYGTGSDTTGNGAMPVIGLRMDEDSAYYWTLNGTWLLEKGNKVQIRSTLPQLKLQSGYWYLSNDRQQAGQQFGKATDADCDKTFQSVTQDDYNVYILLANGEEITLRKMSELIVQITEQDTLLQFRDNETQTIHYTITGDTADLAVKVEMQNDDGGYTLRTTPASKTAGTVEIQAKTPTENHVIISVSDGRQTVQASIAVSALLFDGQTIQVETPGTLGKLLADYDLATITKLRVIGSINDEDIATLKALPNLSVLDIEDTDLIKLPSAAFMNNKILTSIKLPQSLTTIGCFTFYGCSGLTGALTIPNSVTEIGADAFTDCSGLTGDLAIPSCLTTIGDWAFSGCSGLTGTLTIPEGVRRIGVSAFKGCTGLTSLTISVGVKTIEEWAFNGCTGLTGNLTIPNSVTTIGKYAFSNCSGLTGNLTIPNSVTTIGANAFRNCAGFTGTLTISNSVTTIEQGAFWYCAGLTSVTIPSNVTTIEQGAFSSCFDLTRINCKPNTPPQLGSDVFWGVISTPNCVLYVPTGCAEAYRTAEGWKDITFKDIIETEF